MAVWQALIRVVSVSAVIMALVAIRVVLDMDRSLVVDDPRSRPSSPLASPWQPNDRQDLTQDPTDRSVRPSHRFG